ncbi:FAD-dependent oxidoreductase [Bradyrhizobium sp. LCT2]|uniref:flavin monoamine oxidase family protein n=1 Tax=Bradyrhizobium sp. LCT2 TaxID=2493093 RepID=UPI001FED5ED5|nr:FAD-dependent oxidoreductase [Bradyrhizobium sp. LCT2]
MFQPVGGMDMIGKAFARELGELIRYSAKVTEIWQNVSGVTVTYVDAKNPAQSQKVTADWCPCTIPLSILSQLPINVGAAMKAAIDAVPYTASVKVGLQFKRPFWEEDDAIYGGISYTDLPIREIGYPNTDYNKIGRGIPLGAYLFEGANSFESPPCRRMSAWRARSSLARLSILNTGRSSKTASRLAPGAIHAWL